jgi:hypothetical protein
MSTLRTQQMMASVEELETHLFEGGRHVDVGLPQVWLQLDGLAESDQRVRDVALGHS